MKTFFVFTGPESSGKTSLSSQLAEELGLSWVPEYARSYLDGKTLRYTLQDLDTIAENQIMLELDAVGQYIICDTDLLTLYIWKREVFKEDDPALLEPLRKHNRHYLLCKPNIPWVPDPLRENPFDRERLFDIYVTAIEKSGIPFTVLDNLDYYNRYLQGWVYIDSILKCVGLPEK